MIELKLNKVDVDIRRELAKEVKDRKVNRKGNPKIDNKMKKPFVENNGQESKKKKKETIVIDGVYKEEEITINAKRDEKDIPIGGIINSLK